MNFSQVQAYFAAAGGSQRFVEELVRKEEKFQYVDVSCEKFSEIACQLPSEKLSMVSTIYTIIRVVIRFFL